MVSHQHLRIPCTRHHEGLHAAAQWRREDVADLQADQEGEGDDDDREAAVSVVLRIGELEVEVGEQGAGVGNESGAPVMC